MVSSAEPGVMTSAGAYAALLDGLPTDIAGLARIGQGLMVHEHMAMAYGVTMSDEDRTGPLRTVRAAIPP